MAFYGNNLTWSNIITTTNTSLTYPMTYTFNGPIEDPKPALPKKKSALAWLDDAIEEVCALARNVAIA